MSRKVQDKINVLSSKLRIHQIDGETIGYDSTDAMTITAQLTASQGGYFAQRVGIGTSSPLSTTDLHIETDSNVIVQISRKESGGAGSIADGDDLGAIRWGGTTNSGTNYDYDAAVIRVEADGDWDTSDTDSGTQIHFLTTPDGSNSNAIALSIRGDGKIGIGTTSPMNKLQIDHTGADGDDGLMIVRADSTTADTNLLGGIGFDSTDGNVPSTITEASVFIAAYAAEAHGTGDKGGDLVFGCTLIDDDDDTASHEYMRITDAGKVGIGCSPAQPFHVLTDNASGYAAKFKNDGDNVNRYGIIIDCGADDNQGTNIPIQFRDGDGHNMGKISFDDGTVSYGAFTAYHPAALPEGIDNYDYGTIVKINSTASTIYGKSVQYEVEKTTTAQDKAVFGVYSVIIGEEYNEDGTPAQEHNRHQIWCLGDGHILVCSEGGNIETGDYICSSYTAGHGMKQNDDLLHNYTVAKATEPVDWSTESGVTKLISCTYHAS